MVRRDPTCKCIWDLQIRTSGRARLAGSSAGETTPDELQSTSRTARPGPWASYQPSTNRVLLRPHADTLREMSWHSSRTLSRSVLQQPELLQRATTISFVRQATRHALVVSGISKSCSPTYTVASWWDPSCGNAIGRCPLRTETCSRALQVGYLRAWC